ncbi:MAG: hypothetical protein PVJ27_11610 [Candidatus Brocadiaceae bacterium]
MGKTRVVERLLPFLGEAVAVKVQVTDRSPARRLEETRPPADESKDTARYLAGGARRAFLLSGTAPELLPLARQIIAEAEGRVVVVETNSLATELNPDLAIFVQGKGPLKPGAERCRHAADLVIATPADIRTGKEADDDRGAAEGNP